MSVMAALKVNARNRWECDPLFARRFCKLGSGQVHIARWMVQTGKDRQSAWAGVAVENRLWPRLSVFGKNYPTHRAVASTSHHPSSSAKHPICGWHGQE